MTRAISIVLLFALFGGITLCAPDAVALDNQTEVLPVEVQKQLDSLSKPRQGKMDIYALVIGGDAGDPVFQREVTTVKRRLEERLGTSGRVVMLVNSNEKPSAYATVSSIDKVIREMGKRMDKGRDLLFVHLTSHGSRDHHLVLSYKKQELKWLGVDDLEIILRRSEVRHRFILISGCYSGGFIKKLSNEDTVVISASGSTVSSYGCGAASAITDFSKAFYVRALAQTRQLVDASRLAMQLVHEDETQRGISHSYPQLSIGANMYEYLRTLAAETAP